MSEKPGPNLKEKQQEILLRLKEGQTEGLSKPYNFSKASLAGEDLSNLNLSGADFSEADLSGTNLSGAQLFKAKFTGANLQKANLSKAELTGSDLTNANLEGADASSSGLGMACLNKARMFQMNLDGASLSKVDLSGADLRCASIKNARMRESDLRKGDFTDADFQHTDLSLSRVTNAVFDNANLQESQIRFLDGYTKASWIGVDIRNINFSGAYIIRRFIGDQNYLKEFRETSRLTNFLYIIWWITCDCGRSLSRWCVLTLIMAVVFALVFTLVGVDYGDYETWLSPFYYSIVTLTTLGYGDVLPVTTAAKIVAILEVIIGYVMLGGLLAILSNKLARRAE